MYSPTAIASRELTNGIIECVEASLAYELKRHYSLRDYPSVITRTRVDYSMIVNSCEQLVDIYVTVTSIQYADSKDSFIMSLRSEDTVLKWLEERAIIIAKGIQTELKRRCYTLLEKPEDVIIDITNAMMRV